MTVLVLSIKNLKTSIGEIIQEHRTPEYEIDPSHRFVRVKNRYQIDNKEIRKENHSKRKFKPEFKNKGEEDMLIKRSIWDKIYPIMKNMHWKVQNGLIFWFAMQINGEDWEEDVLELLREQKVAEAQNKKTCCQVFGEFSKLFKKIRECKPLYGFRGII